MRIRQLTPAKTIALLATGDEIANGDILNTNTPEIAKHLYNLGMHVGMHAVTADNIEIIEKAISFLLESHQALIITGGLGPTSDDLTRFALSNVVQQPLVFDNASWEYIVNRLKQFGYSVPPESNRQQALFPAGATIIPNPNGTAAGCMLEFQGKIIFMLPGPPPECLPMVDNIVIDTLKEKQFQEISFHQSWMLFGVSEGQIAEELDALAQPFDCITGYRIFYPYIEFKIHSNNEEDFTNLCNLINDTIKPYLISEGTQTASDMLIKKLATYEGKIQICDLATGGLLESIIATPRTHQHVLFSHDENISADVPTFILTGLTEYWQHRTDHVRTPFMLTIKMNGRETILKAEAPLRGDRVKRYAVEWMCHQINIALHL